MNLAASLTVSGFIAICIGGCLPLPIPHNEVVTPAVSANFVTASGRPAAGIAVGLTGSSKDTLCTAGAVHRVTDAQGRINAPPTEQRKTIFWLTMMESFGGTSYWLCTGHVDSLGVAVYHTRTAVTSSIRGADLQCLIWDWQENQHVTCDFDRPSGAFVGRAFTGRWRQGNANGTFRVLFAQVGRWQDPVRAYVQWLAGDSSVAMAELPDTVSRRETSRQRLYELGGRWYLTLASTKKDFWGRPHWLTFEIGALGEVRLAKNGQAN